jgi:hypothetical protein
MGKKMVLVEFYGLEGVRIFKLNPGGVLPIVST